MICLMSDTTQEPTTMTTAETFNALLFEACASGTQGDDSTASYGSSTQWTQGSGRPVAWMGGRRFASQTRGKVITLSASRGGELR